MPKRYFLVIFLALTFWIVVLYKYSGLKIPIFPKKADQRIASEIAEIPVLSDRSKYELLVKGEIKPPKTPGLYVDGPNIKRADTQKPVQLKGVSSMAYVYYDYDIHELINHLDKVKKWGINLLGLFINYDNLKNKYGQLDEIINWSENNGIYVYLMPAVNKYDPSPRLSTQISLFPQMMKDLASRYSQKTNILYGLWAEPRLVFWDEWIDKSDKIASGIREVNPQAIILATGIQWGRYFYIDKKPFPFGNIIYDYHDYPFINSYEAQKYNGKNPDGILWDKMIGKYPILIGEFGGVAQKDFGSSEDTDYITKVLDSVNENHLNYTAYTIDAEGGLGLIDWRTGQPTQKGKVIQDDLISHPPTFID